MCYYVRYNVGRYTEREDVRLKNGYYTDDDGSTSMPRDTCNAVCLVFSRDRVKVADRVSVALADDFPRRESRDLKIYRVE